MRMILALGLTFFSHFSWGQTPEEQPLQPLRPSVLLKSKEHPQHYFFVGVSGSNHYVFEVKTGEVKRHLLTPASTTYFDGGSMDLYTPEGLRIIIPTAQQTENYLRLQSEPVVVYPNQPREAFHRIQPTKKKLRELGLEKYLDPTPVRRPRHKATRLTEPEKFEFYIVTAKKDEDRDFRQQIRALDDSKQKNIIVVDEYFGAKPGAFVWLHPSRVADLKNLLGDAEVEKFEIKPTTKTLKDFAEASFVDQLSILKAAVQAPELDTSFIDWKYVWTVQQTMESLARAYSTVESVIYYDARINGDEAKAKEHVFNAKFAKPLRASARDLLEVLYRLNNSLGYKGVISMAGRLQGVGFSMLNRPFGTKANALEYFLDWNRESLRQVSDFPATISRKQLEDLGWSRGKHSGGIFDHIHVSGENTYWTNWKDGESRLYSRDIFYPDAFYILSLKGEAALAKKAILQFVIDADHQIVELIERDNIISIFNDFVEKAPLLQKPEAIEFARRYWMFSVLSEQSLAELRALNVGHSQVELPLADLLEEWKQAKINAYREHERYAEKVKGYEILHRVFLYLGSFGERLRDPKAKEIYYSNVADILTELLETSPQTLKSSGTYTSLLNTAMGLMRKIEAMVKDGRLPKANLQEKMLRFYTALGKRTTEQISLAGRDQILTRGGGAYACRLLLSPDPWSR